MKRLAALLCCCALLGAVPNPHAPKHVGKRVLPIAIVLNGVRLAVNPAPVFVRYHLLVPVRRVLSALGLAFEKDGRYVRTYVGAKTISLLIGSRVAQVDEEPVLLDTAPVELQNTLYAPLRFFTDALGAQAVFHRQTNSVEIVSALVGRSGNGVFDVDGGVQMNGTVSAIDPSAVPVSVTLVHNAAARTVTVNPDASVIAQDVISGTSADADLSSVHVGDFAELRLDRAGNVKEFIDVYGTRAGHVAAAGSGALVLADGHVIVPDRDTTVTLNGDPTTTDALRIGDALLVRYNVDSSEIEEIQATRAVPAPHPPDGSTIIRSISFSPAGPLRAGETLNVAMQGTPGGLAGYDIGAYVTGRALTETQPGFYTGSYVIPAGVDFSDAPIFGHLNVRGDDAPEAVASQTLSVASAPPGIAELAPETGASVNASRPSIFATFVAGTAPVDPSSESLVVNGHNVTASCLRTQRFIDYTPGIDYPAGPMHVRVRVADEAGNVTERDWTFFIKR